MGVSLRWTSQRGRRWRSGDGGDVAGWSSWLNVEASTLATSVAVMAPALTEGGPQKPENLLPALPAGGFLSTEQAKQVCHSAAARSGRASIANHEPTVCQNCEVLAQFVVSANVQPSKIDEQCLQGIPKDLINDVINLKFSSGLDGLSDLIAVAPRKETREVQASSAAIMNDPSMGDPVDSMCFFKTIMGPGETEESCEIADITGDVAKAQGNDEHKTIVSEEKQIEDDRSLEQIMGFATDMNVQTGDISQNVEEILQVIKSMEHAAESVESIGSDNRLTGGCGGLVEATSQSVSGSVSEIFPDSESFPLNLLNDVDVMGLCNDNMSDTGVVDQQALSHSQQQHLSHHNQQNYRQQQQQQQHRTVKLNDLAQHQAQVERRQHELERRAAFLVRRLRKLQSSLVGEHVAEEASYVLEMAQKSAKKCFYQDLASLGPKTGNTRNFPELAGSLGSFLQKVQKSCNAQSNSIALRQRNSCRYFGAGSKDNYANPVANRVPVFGIPQIKLSGEELEKVTGPLAVKLKILQNAYDSDCTASSSGGESCDEMQTFNNPHQQHLPIAKRAAWRYAQDRASVASRWTWLQAQISDLEYKIRQHNELQRQIRAAKGLVTLEISTPIAVSSVATVTASPTTTTAETVNGYSGILPGSTPGRGCVYDGPEPPASRTRPFARAAYRKRKLVQLEGLHEVSKKAARPATLRCSCDGSAAPCALCTGRREPTMSHDLLELLSVHERVAVVDAGFHPVLSQPDEVAHALHMDAIMRSTEWQQKMLRGALRISKLKDKDGNERRNKKVSEHRTKYPTRLKKSQTTLLSARIKRKFLKGKRSRSTSERTNHGIHRKRGSKHHQQSQSQLSLMDEEEEVSALSSSSKYSSPVPSPLQQLNTNMIAATTSAATVPPPSEKNTLKEKSTSHTHSRLRQNSYDIDNIVISYSVASSTRLEKLPYKEIQIPKWRLCDDSSNLDVKNGAVQRQPIVDNDVEDVSDEAIAVRHERSEREENKRFMTFINMPHQSRIRQNRRTDSRTDSGANTPDPMSPHASDFGGDVISPITSPPATPSNIHDSEQSQQHQQHHHHHHHHQHQHQQHQSETHHRSASIQNALHRRTMSSTRPLKEESTSSFNEEEHEQVLPYEPRIFPLTDEDYEKMLEVMPGGHLQPSSISVCSQDEEKIDEAEVDSQESDSTESALCDIEGEDPNDPEWTVAEARETEKERIRPTAKR